MHLSLHTDRHVLVQAVCPVPVRPVRHPLLRQEQGQAAATAEAEAGPAVVGAADVALPPKAAPTTPTAIHSGSSYHLQTMEEFFRSVFGPNRQSVILEPSFLGAKKCPNSQNWYNNREI